MAFHNLKAVDPSIGSRPLAIVRRLRRGTERRRRVPLGPADALREAMSECARYRSSQGLLGMPSTTWRSPLCLRWAKSRASRPIDKDIWSLFGAFERGLLQYWHLRPAIVPPAVATWGRSALRRFVKESAQMYRRRSCWTSVA